MCIPKANEALQCNAIPCRVMLIVIAHSCIIYHTVELITPYNLFCAPPQTASGCSRLYVLDQVSLFGLIRRVSPIAGVLIGVSPVNMNIS